VPSRTEGFLCECPLSRGSAECLRRQLASQAQPRGAHLRCRVRRSGVGPTCSVPREWWNARPSCFRPGR
jgi:hypothetical protein